MDHRTRFVFASNLPLEESIRWAIAHDFTRVDFNADVPANYPGTLTPERGALIRDLLAQHDAEHDRDGGRCRQGQ